MTSLYYCAWTSLGITVGNVQKRGGSAHPTHGGVMLPVLCLSKLYTLFHHSVPYRSSHAKPLLKAPKKR